MLRHDRGCQRTIQWPEFTDTLRISVEYNVLSHDWGVNVQSNDHNLQIRYEFQLITMC